MIVFAGLLQLGPRGFALMAEVRPIPLPSGFLKVSTEYNGEYALYLNVILLCP